MSWRRIVLLAMLVAGMIFGFLAMWTAWHWEHTPLLSWAGLSALFAGLAVLGGATAAYLAWPQYNAIVTEQLRKPIIATWLETSPNDRTPAVPVPPSNIVETLTGDLILRVAIANTGDAALRDAMVNIAVPISCDIEPLDPPEKVHYRSPMPTVSRDLRWPDDDPTIIHFTVARDTITPGSHVFHVMLHPHTFGDTPVYVEIEGDWPETAVIHRITLRNARASGP
jgi:hypothetical protein